MKTLKIDGMHCEMCAKRITDALTQSEIAHTVSLSNKTVSFTDESRLNEVIEILDDLGFDVTE